MPWEGFTMHWFVDFFRDKLLWAAILNTVIIAIGVICLSIPIGLAGAFLLTNMQSRTRSLVYSIMISPILTPGVIIGISTLIFWDNFGVPGGIFLAIIGQTTFIASFCMLLVMARLQRFDKSLEEAAFDLGAGHLQVFWRITIPFLMPSILSATLIAFLLSIDNFNTTLFVIGTETTMTLAIASKVRLGLTPMINAFSVFFIVFTIIAAIVYGIYRQKEAKKALVH